MQNLRPRPRPLESESAVILGPTPGRFKVIGLECGLDIRIFKAPQVILRGQAGRRGRAAIVGLL